jgi:ABC-type maltose transport system permease subunit
MKSFPTVAYGLLLFQNNPTNLTAFPPIKIAGAMMLFSVVFVLFISFRKKLIGDLTVGGLKG